MIQYFTDTYGRKMWTKSATYVFPYYVLIFCRQASLTRQAFLLTALHGARSKTGKTLTQKSSAM